MTPGMASTIATLMTEGPMLINPDDPLELAESVMQALHARHWPVVRDRSLLGILSLRDLLAVARDDHPHLTAGQFMTVASIAAHPNDNLSSAAALMNHHRLWCLPVVDDGELVGIVTLNHFVEHAAMMLREEEYEFRLAPTVSRLMTPAPLGAIQVRERVDVAQALMRRHDVRHLLVMKEERLMGMLSERDILEVLRSRAEPAWAIRTGEIMTSALETTTPEADAAEAGILLVRRNIGALPVLRDGRVMGILCKSDFLRYVITTAPLRQGA
jgi:CBS domain-containing protein